MMIGQYPLGRVLRMSPKKSLRSKKTRSAAAEFGVNENTIR